MFKEIGLRKVSAQWAPVGLDQWLSEDIAPNTLPWDSDQVEEKVKGI